MDKDMVESIERQSLQFAESLVDSKGSFRGQTISTSGITSNSMESMLSNPIANYTRIAAYMEAMVKEDGTINRLISYLQSHLTYNYTIFPKLNEKNNFQLQGGMEDYLAAASFIDKYNIKFFAPYFVKQVLINGMAFFYIEKNAKGVSYMQLPIDWCRISSLEDGVYRFAIDMSKIKDDMIAYLPQEIAKAYETYKSGVSEDDKKWIEKKYYMVSNKGVAFTLSQSVLKDGGVAISEFASLLLDSTLVKQAKKNIRIKDQIDTIKLVHSKIPLDSDGKPSISAKVAKVYDNALKRALPEGIAGVTSPMDIEHISLSGSGNAKSYDTVKSAQGQFFMNTGAPANLFGGDTTSSNIVKLSVLKDAAWLFTTVLPMLESYYEYELRKLKTNSGVEWKVGFLRQSYFNADEVTKATKEAVTTGGSRMNYLAAIGMEPLEVYTKLYMEQNMLDIDSIMVPKQMSYTLSGNSGGSEGVGRPKTNNPTDDTDRIQDAE